MRRITQTLTILRRVEGAPDRYGNPTLGWERVAWPVYGVAPRGQAGLSEPFEANRDPIVKGLQVFAPADGPTPVANDRVEHAGVVWTVVGDVARWDNNPHFARTNQRGIVVNLDRMEG